VSGGVVTFPPPSLQAQLDELRRERNERDRRYPLEVARRVLHDRNAQLQNRGLDGAIATLQRLVDAQKRGEPGRAELYGALREALLYVPDIGASAKLHARITDMLAKVPE
jgi:hypothetical protein